MCQNLMNECNDYSLLTAHTGIATVATANPGQDGLGNTQTVVTAGAVNGVIVKNIYIKALEQTLTGMVHLFIVETVGATTTYVLCKEIPIPTMPMAASVPIPAPKYTMYEAKLEGGMRLTNGQSLIASTQNKGKINIIAEAFDWVYPNTLPTVCCNFKQIAANTGIGNINQANTALDGSGAIVTVLKVGGLVNGSTIKRITIKAQQSTQEDTIRLFIGANTASFALLQEISVPVTTQSATDVSFKFILDLDFCLAPGFILGAATDIGQTYSITVDSADWTYPI